MEHERGFPDREMFELLTGYRDETLTSDQSRRLQEILRHEPKAREYFLEYMTLHALLENEMPPSVSEAEADEGRVRRPFGYFGLARPGRKLHLALGFIAASLLIGVVSFFALQPQLPEQTVALSPVVAEVTDLVGVEWDSDKSALTLGESVGAGRIQFASGRMRLAYRHGVVVSVEGPADFTIISDSNAVLRKGRLAAYVPDGAEGFQITTPHAEVVDLGTEFGLTVDDSGETELSVFDGMVELTPATLGAATRVVESGQAYRVDNQGNAKRSVIGLAPYRDARDSIHGYRIVWEPFGRGSETGPFPGSAGAGWLGPWQVDVQDGDIDDSITGIADRRALHPGTEVYLRAGAMPQQDDQGVKLAVSRSFGPIDEFTTAEPYTIELLFRMECDPNNIQRVAVFGVADGLEPNLPPAWLMQATASDQADLSWRVDSLANGEVREKNLPIRWGATCRCFIEVQPQRGLYRVTVSDRLKTISSNLSDSAVLMGPVDGPVRLGVEVEGKDGKGVRFSIDAIRIQNLPSVSTNPAAPTSASR